MLLPCVSVVDVKPLSEDEEKHLAHGPNFAIVPKNPSIIQYVAPIEYACTKLEEGRQKSLEFKSRQLSKTYRNQNPTSPGEKG